MSRRRPARSLVIPAHRLACRRRHIRRFRPSRPAPHPHRWSWLPGRSRQRALDPSAETAPPGRSDLGVGQRTMVAAGIAAIRVQHGHPQLQSSVPIVRGVARRPGSSASTQTAWSCRRGTERRSQTACRHWRCRRRRGPSRRSVPRYDVDRFKRAHRRYRPEGWPHRSDLRPGRSAAWRPRHMRPQFRRLARYCLGPGASDFRRCRSSHLRPAPGRSPCDRRSPQTRAAPPACQPATQPSPPATISPAGHHQCEPPLAVPPQSSIHDGQWLKRGRSRGHNEPGPRNRDLQHERGQVQLEGRLQRAAVPGPRHHLVPRADPL
ncbi:MAG: hypothetical protein ACI9WU_002062 [Myxococcota bacterium]|jgi:hypothetical protein